jgi:hypothetical protein
MDLLTGPLIWAQAQPGAVNPNSLAPLALRRWCASLTLCSSETIPNYHGLWAFVAALTALVLAAVVFQGPIKALKQLFDLPGHIDLFRKAVRRVWRAGRLVAVAIGFTVLAWTGSQAMMFSQESGKADLVLLTKARGLGELSVEQGILAGLTPLRDVAGLGDNLPLLIVAVIVVFRASIEPHGELDKPLLASARAAGRPYPRPGWTTVAWGVGAMYALYRIVARAAGSVDLPLGGCLVVEAFLVPLAMLIADGFLLAWLLTELRNAQFDLAGEDRLDPLQAIALMPGSALACALALPARYMAAFVFLAQLHLPTSVYATALGRYIRWQLRTGLTDLQAVALLFLGVVGVVAWTRGTMGGMIQGYRRLLTAEAGHLVAALAMAGMGTAVLSAMAYLVLLLLPVQSWVLAAADSYAHYLTLPVGLWTVAALVELAQRSLPAATLARTAGRHVPAQADHPAAERSPQHEPHPAVGAPTA